MRITALIAAVAGMTLSTYGIADSGTGMNLQRAYVGAEAYLYPEHGRSGQTHGSLATTAEVELKSSTADGWSGRLTPFVRLDAIDPNRNRFDLREAAAEYTKDQWKLYCGMGKVSWSVTESVNIIPYQVVDVLNQRDFAADAAGQEKLGAAMLAGSYQADAIRVELYALPWFRPRPFPSRQARENSAGGSFELNDKVQYTSESGDHRTNWAFRLEKQMDSANVAFIQYQGYAPQPVVTPDFATLGSTSLYYLVNMSGVTVQAAFGQWLFKTEAAYFSTRLNPSRPSTIPDSYTSGVVGTEYTIVRFAGESDLGILAEWIRDTRGDGPAGTPFPKDIFLGLRWVANDADDSQLLGGVVRNLHGRDAVYQVQYERRLFSKYWLHIGARSYAAKQDSPLSTLRQDDVVYARLKYFFY